MVIEQPDDSDEDKKGEDEDKVKEAKAREEVLKQARPAPVADDELPDDWCAKPLRLFVLAFGSSWSCGHPPRLLS